MKNHAFAVPIVLAAVVAAVAPARADDATGVQAAVRSALRAAKSFTVTLAPAATGADAGGNISYVVVEPGRYHQIFAPGSGTTVETIVIGTTLYDRQGPGPFHYTAFPQERQAAFLAPLFDVRIVSVGPDVVENGRTLGTFVATDPLAEKDDVTMTCTYEKTSSRPLACRGAQTLVTYARYDDPALSVDVPAGATPYK